jgi:hypothetical protein
MLSDYEKTVKFGVEWNYRISRDDILKIFCFTSPKFGDFIITGRALNRIKEADDYKILSLIYEQTITNNGTYLIILADEKDQLRPPHDDYILLNLDELLSRFPLGLIEKQHRSLLLLNKLYPEYGQDITKCPNHLFFAKNNLECCFILDSMAERGWINIHKRKSATKETVYIDASISITYNGWLEIEKAMKNVSKKQVFIAMKFKDMDNVYNAIYNAIINTTFIPLRTENDGNVV